MSNKAYQKDNFTSGQFKGLCDLMALLYKNQTELYLDVEDVLEIIRKYYKVSSLDRIKYDQFLSPEMYELRQKVAACFSPDKFVETQPHIAKEKEEQTAKWNELLNEQDGFLLFNNGERRSNATYSEWADFWDDLKNGNRKAAALMQELCSEDPDTAASFDKFESIFKEFTGEERFCAKLARIKIKIEDMPKGIQNEYNQALAELKKAHQTILFKFDNVDGDQKGDIAATLGGKFNDLHLIFEKNEYDGEEEIHQAIEKSKKLSILAQQIVSKLATKNALSQPWWFIVAAGCTIGLIVNFLLTGAEMMAARKLPMIALLCLVALVSWVKVFLNRSKIKSDHLDESITELHEQIRQFQTADQQP